MKIYRHYQSVPPSAAGAVIAIGNFDGIHRGHQAVIAKAQEISSALDAPCAVMSFEPHPRRFFQPDLDPFRLTSFRVKSRLIAALGVDTLFAQPFNRRFSQLSGEDFIADVLTTALKGRHIVVGEDFQFGKGRGGTTDLLTAAGQIHGFGVTALSAVTGNSGAAYSSTLVRQYLSAGNVTRAAMLLGRYWELEGRIRRGRQLGRTIGFPTANFSLGEILRPAFGVYAVRVDLGDGAGWRAGVANIGVRPTVEGNAAPQLEVHMFDFDADIYGRHARVALVDFLRPEQKFDGIDALKAQIAADSERARATLAWEGIDDAWPSSSFLGDGPE